MEALILYVQYPRYSVVLFIRYRLASIKFRVFQVSEFLYTGGWLCLTRLYLTPKLRPKYWIYLFVALVLGKKGPLALGRCFSLALELDMVHSGKLAVG